MDKRPPYLVTTEHGELAIEIYDTDSEYVKKIKLFMAAHGIIDIKMRMLKISELLKIQGFDDDYKLIGTQAKQKWFIGNAVVPVVVKSWFEAIYQSNLPQEIKKAV
jgi:DNA (cytosine-5)-methyltransferase 1